MSYEVHTVGSSPALLNYVSKFVRRKTGGEFAGMWMVVAEWRDVPEAGTAPPTPVSYRELTPFTIETNWFGVVPFLLHCNSATAWIVCHFPYTLHARQEPWICSANLIVD